MWYIKSSGHPEREFSQIGITTLFGGTCVCIRELGGALTLSHFETLIFWSLTLPVQTQGASFQFCSWKGIYLLLGKTSTTPSSKQQNAQLIFSKLGQRPPSQKFSAPKRLSSPSVPSQQATLSTPKLLASLSSCPSSQPQSCFADLPSHCLLLSGHHPVSLAYLCSFDASRSSSPKEGYQAHLKCKYSCSIPVDAEDPPSLVQAALELNPSFFVYI